MNLVKQATRTQEVIRDSEGNTKIYFCTRQVDLGSVIGEFHRFIERLNHLDIVWCDPTEHAIKHGDTDFTYATPCGKCEITLDVKHFKIDGHMFVRSPISTIQALESLGYSSHLSLPQLL
jgi:hypothetical protein